MAFHTIDGKAPVDEGAVFVADNATLAGDVRLEEGSSVWYGAVLRADTGRIVVGAGSNVPAAAHRAGALPHHGAGHAANRREGVAQMKLRLGGIAPRHAVDALLGLR